jgi:hypothetical protein
VNNRAYWLIPITWLIVWWIFQFVCVMTLIALLASIPSVFLGGPPLPKWVVVLGSLGAAFVFNFFRRGKVR